MVLRDFKASMDWIAEEEGIWEAAGGVNVKVAEMILSVLSPGHRYRREDGGLLRLTTRIHNSLCSLLSTSL